MKLIPKHLLKKLLDNVITKNTTLAYCENCKNIVDIDMIPYAYDNKTNNVICVGKCTHCNELIFSYK